MINLLLFAACTSNGKDSGEEEANVIPIVFHREAEENGLPNIPRQILDLTLSGANSYFQNAGFKYLFGNTTAPADEFLQTHDGLLDESSGEFDDVLNQVDDPDTSVVDVAVLGRDLDGWYAPSYLVDLNMINEYGNAAAGFATKGVGVTLQDFSPDVFSHELGHYFGLKHTLDPSNIMCGSDDASEAIAALCGIVDSASKGFSSEQIEDMEKVADKFVHSGDLELMRSSDFLIDPTTYEVNCDDTEGETEFLTSLLNSRAGETIQTCGGVNLELDYDLTDHNIKINGEEGINLNIEGTLLGDNVNVSLSHITAGSMGFNDSIVNVSDSEFSQTSSMDSVISIINSTVTGNVDDSGHPPSIFESVVSISESSLAGDIEYIGSTVDMTGSDLSAEQNFTSSTVMITNSTLDGANGFDISSVEIKNCTITAPVQFSATSASVRDSSIADVESGGLYTYDSTLNVTDSIFTNNAFGISGFLASIVSERNYYNENEEGISVTDSTLIDDSSIFVQNPIAIDSTDGSLEVYNTRFDENTNSINSNGTDVTLSAVYFKDNSSAIYSLGSVFNISSSSFEGHTDGAITVYSASEFLIQDSTFINNAASLYGGAINVYEGMLSVQNTYFGENSSVNGGAICASGTLTVDSSEFFGNSASQDGGALYVDGGSANITGTDFNFNLAGNGGAMSVSGDAVIYADEVSFEDNAVMEYGGAVHIADGTNSSSFTNAYFAGNGAVHSGDALYAGAANVSIGTSWFYNQTLSTIGTTLGLSQVNFWRETPDADASVADLYLDASDCTITNTSLLDQSGQERYGIYSSDSTLQMIGSTVVSTGSIPLYVSGGDLALDHSAIFSNPYNNTCLIFGASVTTNYVGSSADSDYCPITSNPISPSNALDVFSISYDAEGFPLLYPSDTGLIDSGDVTCPLTDDLVGTLRPQGGRFDIGALEVLP